jgi:hypothetical protein
MVEFVKNFLFGLAFGIGFTIAAKVLEALVRLVS